MIFKSFDEETRRKLKMRNFSAYLYICIELKSYRPTTANICAILEYSLHVCVVSVLIAKKR